MCAVRVDSRSRGERRPSEAEGAHGGVADPMPRLEDGRQGTTPGLIHDADVIATTGGLELLRLAEDGPLVAAGSDIASWYGADASPELRHAVHCIADEVFRVRGVDLARNAPGELASALRGLASAAWGTVTPHGVDLIEARVREVGGADPEPKFSRGLPQSAGLRGRTGPGGLWYPVGFPEAPARPQRSRLDSLASRSALRRICIAAADADFSAGPTSGT